MKKDLKCEVYIVSSEAGPVKIGVSNDVGTKMKNLQTYSPFILTYEKGFPCTFSDGIDIEQCVYGYLDKFRLIGGWFDVEPQIAINAVQAAIQAIKTGKPIPFKATSRLPIDREECLRRAREGARLSHKKPGPSLKLSEKELASARKAWKNSNESNAEIAKRFGVHKQTLWKAFGSRK